MSRINQSWREQAKAVLTSDGERYQSVWMAAVAMAEQFQCKHSTARKEIRKAISQHLTRYGKEWRFEE